MFSTSLEVVVLSDNTVVTMWGYFWVTVEMSSSDTVVVVVSSESKIWSYKNIPFYLSYTCTLLKACFWNTNKQQ